MFDVFDKVLGGTNVMFDGLIFAWNLVEQGQISKEVNIKQCWSVTIVEKGFAFKVGHN